MSGEENEAVAEDHQHPKANSDRERRILQLVDKTGLGVNMVKLFTEKSFASEKKR